MADYCSRFVYVLGSDIPGVSPAGRCAPLVLLLRRFLPISALLPSLPGRPPPPPPVVLASSYVAEPSISSPLHLALLSVISSRSVPSAQYLTPAPSMHCLTCGSSVALFLPLTRAAVVAFASVFLLAAPTLLCVSPPPPLFLPLAPIPPPPPSLGLLRLPAPPCAPPPPAPAANIARKDKDVGNWTSGVVARGSVASGSAPCGKRAAPYSYTYPSSSTPCTAGRHRGICTIERTGPWWSRSSSGCNYRTA